MKRIATQTIVLHREGKRVVIKPRQQFDFTAAEIKEITETSPDALRKPVNEDDDVVEVKAPTANPDASVPAPKGNATAPVTGSKSNPKPADAKSAADEL